MSKVIEIDGVKYDKESILELKDFLISEFKDFIQCDCTFRIYFNNLKKTDQIKDIYIEIFLLFELLYDQDVDYRFMIIHQLIKYFYDRDIEHIHTYIENLENPWCESNHQITFTISIQEDYGQIIKHMGKLIEKFDNMIEELESQEDTVFMKYLKYFSQ